MKKKFIIIASLILIAGLSFAASFALSNRRTGQTVLTDQYQQQIDVTGAVIVNLTPQGALPDSVNVKVGQTVEFRAADGKSHALSLGEGSSKRGASARTVRLAHNGEDNNSDKTDAQSTENTHQHDEVDFSSGEFKANESWRVTIKEAGTYFFHDHLNPDLNILVVAYQPAER